MVCIWSVCLRKSVTCISVSLWSFDCILTFSAKSPLGLISCRRNSSYPMHENTTVRVSFAGVGAESLYVPSRPVLVPIAVPSILTVTNSMGEFSASTTLPCSLTCAMPCRMLTAMEIIARYMRRCVTFMFFRWLFYNLFNVFWLCKLCKGFKL